MADRILNINQQIALLPAFIPDSVLDFLEDFHLATALQSETARSAYDLDYLKNDGDQLKKDLEAVCKGAGPLKEFQVEVIGKDMPNGFLIRLVFEFGVRGIALLTNVKERTIRYVYVQPEKYSEPGLRDQLKIISPK